MNRIKCDVLGRGQTSQNFFSFRCVLLQLRFDALQLFFDDCVWSHLYMVYNDWW